MPPLRIAIPIYPNVDMIDVAATVDPLGRIPAFSPFPLELHLAAAKLDPILTGQKIEIVPTKTFADYEKDEDPLDVLLLPGASDVSGATSDSVFMDFVRTQGETARMITSVCTGALVLGTAGLLNGYRATTHWGAIDALRAMQGIRVVNGYPRWVHDRNRLTAGGVSSSRDATLYLISILAGEQAAKCIQLVVQYNPQPPFQCGDPAIADTDTYVRVMYGAGG